MTIRNNIIFIAFWISTLLTFFAACTSTQKKERMVIAFSQCIGGPWRDLMLEEMKRELSFHPNITFLYKQADANTQQQIDQVNELLKQKPDLLIISPNEADPLTPVVEQAFKAGTPVIVIDRKINSTFYTTYVGSDNYELGRIAGEYAGNLLKGKGNIIEVTTLPGSSPAYDRHKGFLDAIKNYPSIRILQEINGEWLKQNDAEKVWAILKKHADADLVFAQNDFLALKIADLYTQNKVQKPKIIGVDGLPGKDEGMQLVTDKVITATMLYPTGGEEAIREALKILQNQQVAKENLLQTTVIDSTNVRIMLMQAAKASSQQQQIERQHQMLTEQIRVYNNQRNFVYILVSSLILSLAFGSFAFYAQWAKRKINKKLQLQNLEISDQKTRLEIMSSKAQAANEAKVNFFTNISHEFRTPLTLILGPLEELLANTKNQYNTIQSLSLIQKNVFRLLRLINQLMDFRKIEADKMKLKASANDLLIFVTEIIQSYKSIAQKRSIDLRLITQERKLEVWMDINMLDKVIFNLLSNAFKFTKDHGFIHVYVTKDEKENEAVIKVEDNGVGMSEDALANAFEVFYQGDYENYKGSGLGLALSRELIHLHKGSIGVSSVKWKGTTFEIRLPLGNAHLSSKEMQAVETHPSVFYENEKIYTSELEIKPFGAEANHPEATGKDQSVLIIEDNEDLRHFLARKLSDSYEILEAENGQTALLQAFDNIPDLIICDLVIPGNDGMTLTHIFKTDIRTSHIPIILLTAKTNIEQQIEGMKNRADAYITKPFNLLFVEQTIKSLLANRALLKEHFTTEISSALNTQSIGKPDRKFMNEFTSLVESNIANESFSVEEICKSMAVSKGLLYKKVKALLDMSVNDYILNARLQKAKYLLQHEDYSISEISYKVGFSSPTYFSTVFKYKFGVTPSVFKEKL